MRKAILLVPVMTACASAPVVTMPCPDTSSSGSSLPVTLVPDAFDSDESTTLAMGFAIENVGVQAELELDAGRCVEFSLALARGVLDGDLEVFSREGDRLTYDDGPERFARVRVCVAPTTSLVVRATAGRGAGDVAIRVGAESPAALTGHRVHDARDGSPNLSSVVAAALEARGYRLDPPRDPVRVDSNVPLRLAVDVAANDCLAVVARGSSELAIVFLDDSGRELATDSGHEHELRVERCGDSTGVPAAIELRSPTGDTVELVVGRGDVARIGGNPGVGGSR